jgi:peptide/nickel transport system permease protein
MIAYILRRLIASLGVMIAVGLIAFAMFRYLGDPVNQMVGVETSLADRNALRHQLGLDEPTLVQAGRFLAHASLLDFGMSYQFKQPVRKLIAERLPATLELALAASLISLLMGVPMGVAAALNPKGALARLLQAISLIGVSLPTFLVGVLLIYLFAVILRWLPSFGRGDVVRIGWWTTGLLTVSGLKSLIMPALTLALFQMTLIMRLVRAEMLEVLRADYIRFARARGLSNRAVHFRHALKNTLVPVMTVVALQLGSIVAFSIITETVFAWPGMGQLFLQSIQNVDVPVMAAYLICIAALFVMLNLVVDLLYVWVDPRLKGSLDRARG